MSGWPRFYSWDRYGLVLVWPWWFRVTARKDGKQARAGAFGPLMLLRHEDQVLPFLFNHERIHVVQNLQLGIVGGMLLYYAEFFMPVG